MILGKLSTPIIKVYQKDALNVSSGSADYVVVGVKKYVVGEDLAEFELRFGNVIVENDQERFDLLIRHSVWMTSEELSTWGTDDTVLLDLIAAKVNIQIVEWIVKDLHVTY